MNFLCTQIKRIEWLEGVQCCPHIEKSWKLGNKYSMCWLLETSRNDENFNATNGGSFVKIERQNFWFFFIPLATIKRITSNRCWFKTTQKFYDTRIMNCWTLEKTIINFYIISLFFRSQYVILLSTTAGGLKSARGSSISHLRPKRLFSTWRIEWV